MVETSVIIVGYNSEKYLNDCFDSLKNQTYDDFEIVFVDNNSKDKTKQILKKYPEIICCWCSSNLGYAGGNNIGVDIARGKYVVLLNPDTKADKNFLKELIKTMKSNRKIGACQPKILIMNKPELINTVELATNYLGFSWCGQYMEPSVDAYLSAEICFASGAASIYRRDVYEKVGGLDTDYFMYHEDTDLSWGIRLLNYKIMFNPDAIVYHDYSFGRNKNKIYNEEKNRLVTILKNYKLHSLFLISPMFFVSELGLFASGFYKEKLKSYVYIFKNIVNIYDKRKFIQERRKVPDSKIVKFFEGKLKFSREIDSKGMKYFNAVSNFYWKIIIKFI